MPAAESSLDALERLAGAGLGAQELLEQAAERMIPNDGLFLTSTDPETTLHRRPAGALAALPAVQRRHRLPLRAAGFPLARFARARPGDPPARPDGTVLSATREARAWMDELDVGVSSRGELVHRICHEHHSPPGH